MPDTDWRKYALAALEEARAEILGSPDKMVMTIITVTEADLLGDRPVSFFGNITFASLGPFLAYCAERIAAKEEARNG